MKKLLFRFSLIFLGSHAFAQTYIDESYDDLMYMSSVYPVEIIDKKVEAVLDTVSVDTHSEAIKEAKTKKKEVEKPVNLIYAVANQKGLVYVETDDDQEVKAIHVINPNGHEILCFPSVKPHHDMVKLDLSSLGPGRYMLILEGRFVSTRDISMNEKSLVALLR
ncbi:MAG: hypothetical protein WED33_02510 [Bacteroidia bacterium]